METYTLESGSVPSSAENIVIMSNVNNSVVQV